MEAQVQSLWPCPGSDDGHTVAPSEEGRGGGMLKLSAWTDQRKAGFHGERRWRDRLGEGRCEKK